MKTIRMIPKSSFALKAAAFSTLCTGLYFKESLIAFAEEKSLASDIFGIRIRNFRENYDLVEEATDLIKSEGGRVCCTMIIHNHTDLIMKNSMVYSYGGNWKRAPRKTLLPGEAIIALANHPSCLGPTSLSGVLSFDLEDFERRMHFMYYVPPSDTFNDNWLALAITPVLHKPCYDIWYAMNYGVHTAIDTAQIVKKDRWRWLKVRQGKKRSRKDCVIEMPRFGCKAYAELDAGSRTELHIHFLPLDADIPRKFYDKYPEHNKELKED